MNRKHKLTAVVAVFVALAFVMPGAAIFANIGKPIENINDSDNVEIMEAETMEALDADWWPMFHHDLANSGYSTSPAPDVSDLLWSYPTGGYISSSPAVVDGKVYFGSADKGLYCLDTDGNKLWRHSIGGRVQSSPAVADGKVYFGSDDKYLYCLDTDGNRLWRYRTGSYLFSAPAVADGKVYFGSRDKSLYCLDTDGNKLWNYPTGDQVYSSPAVVDGKVYFGSDDKYLYCLDTDGNELWNYPTGGGVMSSPAVADGKVYFGSGDKSLYCLDTDGNKLWNYPTGGYVQSSPAVSDGKVYFGSADDYVHCIGTNGSFIWKYHTGGDVRSSPAVALGKVFVGSSDGKVYCFGSSVEHDVGVISIDSPVEGPAGVITPEVTVQSLSISEETDVPVVLQITKVGETLVEYYETLYIDIDDWATQVVTFPEWTPKDWQVSEDIDIEYKIESLTEMATDENPENDYMAKFVTLDYGFFHDTGVTGIISPESGSPGVFTPEVTVENIGQYNEAGVPVHMQITKEGETTPEYDEIETVDITYSETENVIFDEWTPEEYNVLCNINYIVTVGTELSSDGNTSNDGIETTITLGYLHDAGVLTIDSPVSGHAGFITPEVTIKNLGTYNENIPVHMKIVQETFVEYTDAFTRDIETKGEYTGPYTLNVNVEADDNWVTWTFDFPVEEWTGEGNLNVGLIIALDGDGNGPAYQIHNNDGTDASYPWGTWLMSPWDNGWHSSDTNTPVTELAWVEATGNRNVPHGDGILQIKIAKYTLGADFRVGFHWAASPTVGSGFWEVYDVTMQIPELFGWGNSIVDMSQPNYIEAIIKTEIIYYDETVTIYTGRGETQVVTLPDWMVTISSSDTYTVKASTELATDENTGNDYTEGIITLDPFHDVGVKEITDPSFPGGTGDPGTYPVKATIVNYGSFIETNFVVNAEIFKGDDLFWGDYRSIVEIMTGEDAAVAFDYVTLDVGEYRLVVTSESKDDENLDNDQKTISFTIGGEPVDTTPPVTTHEFAGTMGENNWYISNVAIVLTAEDDMSGVAFTNYSIDSGEWQPYEGLFTVSEDGMHTLKYYSVDNAGNTEEIKGPFDFNIDQTPPMTTCDLDGTLEDDIYISDVTVTLNAVSDASDVDYTMYNLDGSGYTIYDIPLVVSDEGDHTVCYYSVDLAGNVEYEKCCTFTISYIEICVSGGFGVSAVIKNIGTTEATDVDWSIILDGSFILLGRETNGTIDSIAAGSSVTVKSNFIFGLCKTGIAVTAGDTEKTVSGFVLGPFVLGVR